MNTQKPKIRVDLDLDEDTIVFLYKKGYSLVAIKPNGASQEKQERQEPQEPHEDFEDTGFKEPIIKDFKTEYEEFKVSFNEFVRLRHGDFDLHDVKKWFDSHKFPFNQRHYSQAKEEYKKLGYIFVVNPDAPTNKRRYRKASELDLTKPPEEKENSKEPEVKIIDTNPQPQEGDVLSQLL